MTPRTRVKICGVTRLEDAQAAVRFGADAIGFVFWAGSPRAVAWQAAREIALRLPTFTARVGVFVNESPAEIARVARDAGLDVVQLHGDEVVADYAGVGRRLLRAMPLSTEADVALAESLPADVTPLVDARDPDRRGGTGRRADWRLAAMLARQRDVLLAGGLSDASVAEALASVAPWGIDVSSGVESAPGIKDHDKLARLFDAVRRAEET